MDRPYDSDENATWHKDDGCDEFEGARLGDANFDGVVKGVANHGDGICPKCIGDSDRSSMLESAAQTAR